eukprot:COSAG05_NODE_2167_length_3442_cov_25.387377_2_plen_235_part_00
MLRTNYASAAYCPLHAAQAPAADRAPAPQAVAAAWTSLLYAAPTTLPHAGKQNPIHHPKYRVSMEACSARSLFVRRFAALPPETTNAAANRLGTRPPPAAGSAAGRGAPRPLPLEAAEAAVSVGTAGSVGMRARHGGGKRTAATLGRGWGQGTRWRLHYAGAKTAFRPPSLSPSVSVSVSVSVSLFLSFSLALCLSPPVCATEYVCIYALVSSSFCFSASSFSSLAHSLYEEYD